MEKPLPTKEELEHSQSIGDVCEEAIHSVLCIRCIRHLNIGMQNTNEFSGGECGGCIAADRDDLQRQLAEAKALELSRGNVLGRIAIAVYGDQNNVTDEQVLMGVQALAMTHEQYKKAGELFSADLVELLSRCQQGYATCIFTAQIIEAETEKLRARLAEVTREREGMTLAIKGLQSEALGLKAQLSAALAAKAEAETALAAWSAAK